MKRTLVIAGGGPAGLASAIHAVERGFAVRVVEPRSGVLDKACGEGLMPAGVASLIRLGIDPSPLGRPFRGIRYVDGSHQAEADFPDGAGLGIRRLELHAALRQRAEALGVTWVDARVTRVEQDTQTVYTHTTDGTTLESDWLVAADGLRSPIRRQLGLDLPRSRVHRIGLRRHYATEPWSDFVEVHWHPEVEAYITPVGPRLVGVAMLVTEKLPPHQTQSPFERLLALFPALEAKLAGAPTASEVRGAGPFETPVARRREGRILLVGDAAGYLDPLTGEGLKLGFLGAEALVDALDQGRPDLWEGRWRGITRRYYWGTLGLLVLTGNPWIRRQMVPVLSRAPWILGGALRTLG